MRLFLLGAVVILLPAGQPARAQPSTPFCSRFDTVPNGTTHVEARTSAGQPCQIGLGMRGGNVEAMQVVMRPAHGATAVSDKQENKRFFAYVPTRGFVGHDRFEVRVRITPPRGGPTYTTLLKIEMNVTP